MKKSILFLFVLTMCFLVVKADNRPVVIHGNNGVVSLDDVTTLSDYLLSQIVLDQFQLAAADVNGDGIVGIADMSALVDMIIGQGANEIGDEEDMLSF